MRQVTKRKLKKIFLEDQIDPVEALLKSEKPLTKFIKDLNLTIRVYLVIISVFAIQTVTLYSGYTSGLIFDFFEILTWISLIVFLFFTSKAKTSLDVLEKISSKATHAQKEISKLLGETK